MTMFAIPMHTTAMSRLGMSHPRCKKGKEKEKESKKKPEVGDEPVAQRDSRCKKKIK